jgi:hypothetical protein
LSLFFIFLKKEMENNNDSLDLSVIHNWVVESSMSDQELGNKVRGFYWEAVNKTKKTS